MERLGRFRKKAVIVTPAAVRALEDELRTTYVFEDHALERMRDRRITYENVATALWSMAFFEAGRDYVVNIWGRDNQYRRLRISLIPELRLVKTVSEVDQWIIGDTLALKKTGMIPGRERARRN